MDDKKGNVYTVYIKKLSNSWFRRRLLLRVSTPLIYLIEEDHDRQIPFFVKSRGFEETVKELILF
jgi:hypothetical protein